MQPSQPTTTGRKRAYILLGVLVALTAVVVTLDLTHHPKTTTTQVVATPAATSITSSGFVPASISIKAGQAVAWTNKDTAAHSIVAGTGDQSPNSNLNSGQSLSQNDTYSYVFDKPGTYAYHDGTSATGFGGVVIVK